MSAYRTVVVGTDGSASSPWAGAPAEVPRRPTGVLVVHTSG